MSPFFAETAFDGVNIYDIYIDECHIVRQQRAASFFAEHGSVAHRLMAELEKPEQSMKRAIPNDPNVRNNCVFFKQNF